MGYLLKEALKTLCGVNQWAYAVFWKIGCQNPKLLIWEECYYEPCQVPFRTSRIGITGSSLAECERHLVNSEAHAGGRIQLPIDEMMVKNQINIVGEGIIGRAAFTGNHQWFSSESFNSDAHPVEVSSYLHDQFSAGIQTIAVIPVSSHGVVKFGSSLSIMENLGFVNHVRSLILQLGCIPTALLSDSYAAKVASPHNFPSESCKLASRAISGQACRLSALATSVHDTLVSEDLDEQKFNTVMKMDPPFQCRSNFLWSNEISWSSDVWRNSLIQMDDQTSADVLNRNLQGSDSMLNGASRLNSPTIFPLVNAVFPNDKNMNNLSNLEGVPLFNMNDHVLPRSSDIYSGADLPKNEDVHISLMESHPSLHHSEYQGAGSQSTDAKCEETSLGHASLGDDLLDILGVALKNEMLGGSFPAFGDEQIPSLRDVYDDTSDFCAIPESFEDGGIFSGLSRNDHLLDAVVSRAQSISKPGSEDNLSCKTTLTKISSSSVLSTNSPTFHGISVPPKHIEDMFGSSKTFMSGCSKEGSCSQSTSFYGSQIMSCVEQSHAVKVENIVLTGHSKKLDGVAKPNRKRLKLGESPRPRPKDRQMIQDRVKELRELVPNGAKCSIDALLEKTIMHMLFLQSITKHADKLKESGESKIINKEGRLLLKDNFEGGATWAFEVGSKPMVCPIIVEDLNRPRQMLVEMLCEECGFLEIADMIQGLGLTILKGVMEARNDKIWARFTVEANRELTRMEIFMSLVRLLDQTAKSNGSSPMVPLHSFPQSASIPTTCGHQ